MLSPVEKRKLRQSAHHLKPVVLVGQHGLTSAVMAEIERALFDHELIKVRFRGHDRDTRAEEIGRVATELTADVVGLIGGTAVLYRENPERKPARSKS
ncbi:MAG: ribosome assembly RNA-binding protein YhbY [Gammaproteobacteria bacterium]